MFDSPSPRGRSGGWILPALFWTGLIVLGTAAASWWLSSSRGSKALEVMDGDTLMCVISFHDVAKAVLEERNFENKLLKAYIKDWPEEAK